MRQKILWAVTFIFLALVVTEIAMRIKGFKPYKDSQHVEIKPHMMFVFDSLLGYKVAAGAYHIDDGGVLWTVTNNPAGYRITSWADTLPEADTLPAVDIYGGAATYGHDLNDESTYPFILQNMLPGYKVHNFAIPDYGVMGNYLLLTRYGKVKKGGVIIYTYKADADVRPSRFWQKMISSNLKEAKIKDFYFATLDTSLNPHLNRLEYHLWPLNNRSVLVNFMEDSYNRARDKEDNLREISKKALLAMSEWCKARGGKFVLVGRQDNPETNGTLKYCADHGVQTVSLSKVNIAIGLIAHENKTLVKDGKDAITAPNKIYALDLFDYLVKEGLVDSNR